MLIIDLHAIYDTMFKEVTQLIKKITLIRNESNERIIKLNNQPKSSFYRLHVDFLF